MLTTQPKPPSGPNLWAGLSTEDIKDLIRADVAELKRLHALKYDDDQLPPQKRTILLTWEIEAIEAAHDQHWDWYREVAAKESRPARSETLG